MTIRPSWIRVAGVVAFGLAGVIPAVAEGVPLFARVAGWAMVFSAPPVLVMAKKTWVKVTGDGVEVGTVRGTKRFVRGESSWQSVAVPGGVLRDGAAIRIAGSDGSSVTVSLGLLRGRDRDVLRQQLGLVLGPEGAE